MKILILEDEVAAAARLTQLIREFNPEAEIVEIIDSVEKGIKYFERNPDPDLVFSDIQLADGNSFEIFSATRPKCPVIFVTAFNEYALEAFKVYSIDYLLKPVNRENLKTALDKYSSIVRPVSMDRLLDALKQADPETKLKDRFLVRFGQKMKVVSVEEINYFYTDNKMVFAVLSNKETYPIDHKLEDLENMLDQHQFFRVNRQFIVRVTAIKDMIILSKSRLKLILNPPIEMEAIVSSEKSALFKEWLGN